MELPEGGWPALAQHLSAGRPEQLRAAGSGVPPTPHLLLPGPSRAGARATAVSTFRTRAVPAAEVQVVRPMLREILMSQPLVTWVLLGTAVAVATVDSSRFQTTSI